MGPNPSAVDNLAEKLAATEKRVAELEQRLARLSITCSALAEHMDLTGEKLTAALARAEVRRTEVFHCERCGKTLQRGIAKCIYCGTPNPHAPP